MIEADIPHATLSLTNPLPGKWPHLLGNALWVRKIGPLSPHCVGLQNGT